MLPPFFIIKQTYFQIINPVKIQSEKFSDQDHCRNLPLVLVDFMYFSCSHCVQDEQMLHSLQKTVRVECTLSFWDFINVLKLKLAKIWNTDLQQKVPEYRHLIQKKLLGFFTGHQRDSKLSELLSNQLQSHTIRHTTINATYKVPHQTNNQT